MIRLVKMQEKFNHDQFEYSVFFRLLVDASFVNDCCRLPALGPRLPFSEVTRLLLPLEPLPVTSMCGCISKI